MHSDPAHTRVDFEDDAPDRPRLTSVIDRVHKQCDALSDRTDRLAHVLEPVLYVDDRTEPNAGPAPMQPQPQLVANLDVILDGLVALTRRIDDLGDRVAL